MDPKDNWWKYMNRTEFAQFIVEVETAVANFHKKFQSVGYDNFLQIDYKIRGSSLHPSYIERISYTIENVKAVECFHDKIIKEYFYWKLSGTYGFPIMCQGGITMSHPSYNDLNLFINLSTRLDSATVIPFGG